MSDHCSSHWTRERPAITLVSQVVDDQLGLQIMDRLKKAQHHFANWRLKAVQFSRGAEGWHGLSICNPQIYTRCGVLMGRVLNRFIQANAGGIPFGIVICAADFQVMGHIGMCRYRKDRCKLHQLKTDFVLGAICWPLAVLRCFEYCSLCISSKAAKIFDSMTWLRSTSVHDVHPCLNHWHCCHDSVLMRSFVQLSCPG